MNEEGLKVEDIKMVMEHANVSRNAAIKVLRETNGDTVQAIMKLSA